MAKYLSNRQRTLDLGISSYTEGSDVLTITGNTIISGIVTAIAGAAVTYYGDGSNLTGITASADVVEDTTPQLGGNLDINGNDITGTGDIDITGNITATSFVGDGSGLSGLSTFSGSYNDLTDKPTIPTNNNQLTNGAGYITGYTVTQSDVTQHQAALSITESQISDLGSYATTSYVDAEIAGIVDSAPGTLDTLNELAAALGDDANFSTTVTNSIATKLPLSGGQMTGNITFSGAQTVDGRDLSVDGSKLDGIESGATADQTASEILTAIKTVDGTGSGLDADLLDGQQGSYYLNTSTTFGGDVSGTYNAIVVADDSHNHIISNVDGLQAALDLKAPLASPALTGTPTAPTASSGTNTTQVATTAFVASAIAGEMSGNAATATTLETARTIGGVSFDGSANINLPGVNTAGNQDTSGNATTATTATNANNINVADESTDTTCNVVFTTGATGNLAPKTGSNLTFNSANGTLTATSFVGDGSNLTGITATADVVNDTTPQLGGNLDINGNDITGTGNINLTGNITVSGTVDGRDVATDGSKLDGIESGATADQTASEILTAIKTVDGSGSGLDADTVDGIQASSFLRSDASDTTTGNLTVNGIVITNELRNRTGQQLVLNAGESHGQATGQTGEFVYVNAESGLQINSTPDNWGSGWAGRNTVEICKADGTSTFPGDVTITGLLSATTKSFVIDHPTKEGMKLRYGSLEGPENGVYVRGRLKDNNTIELPDYWTGLVDEETITVNLTPIGTSASLHSVVDIIDNTVVVESANGSINCFYTVFGERKDVEKLEVEY